MITYSDLTPCIKHRIEHLNSRIARGIAYDFEKMFKVWNAEIELLENTLKFLNKQNDVSLGLGEQNG